MPDEGRRIRSRARSPQMAKLGCAIRGITRRPVRSVLTALGAATCLGALIVAEGISARARDSALEEIRRMGATVLTVSAEASRNRGGRARTGDVVTTLTLRDARSVEREVPGVTLVAAEYRGTVPAKAGDLARQVTVAGVEPSYALVRAGGIQVGRFFTDQESDLSERACVLGARLARDLFRGRSPVGEQIRLRGVPFVVVGVLAERGVGLEAFDEDEVIFVPLSTARRRLFPAPFVQRLFVRMSKGADLGVGSRAISAELRGRHPVRGPEPPDFRVQDQRRLVLAREASIRRLDVFRCAVAATLLLAGAGGIFALQLLSVSQRRSEIGTRRALGATRGAIFAQFMVEGGVLGSVSAAVGVVGGLAGLRIAQASSSIPAVVLGVGAFVAALLLAGALSSYHASRLAPALAMR